MVHFQRVCDFFCDFLVVYTYISFSAALLGYVTNIIVFAIV